MPGIILQDWPMEQDSKLLGLPIPKGLSIRKRGWSPKRSCSINRSTKMCGSCFTVTDPSVICSVIKTQWFGAVGTGRGCAGSGSV